MISHTEYVIYTFNWILPNRTQKSVDDLYIYIYIYITMFFYSHSLLKQPKIASIAQDQMSQNGKKKFMPQ